MSEMWSFIKEKLESVGIQLVRKDERWYYAKLEKGREHNFTPELFIELWLLHEEDCGRAFVETLKELDEMDCVVV